MLNEAVPAGRFLFELVDDDRLAVVDRKAGALSIFNPTAAFLWLTLWEEPRTFASLTADLERLVPSPPDSLAADVSHLIADWRTRGWLLERGGEIRIADACPEPAAGDGTPPPERWEDPEPFGCRTVWAAEKTLFDVSIAFDIAVAATPLRAEFAGRVQALLEGLPDASAPASRRIACRVSEAAITLSGDGRRFVTGDSPSALGRLLLWCLYTAYGEADFLATLHAAAVGRGDGMILLPAASGAGKSTLAAYLVAQGWAYGGDDAVGLGRGAGAGDVVVLPFPSTISVKEGSLPLLEPLYPGLGDLPEIRYEAKRARFLAIDASRIVEGAPDARRPLALVFPRFASDAPTSLTPLSAEEALVSLAVDGLGLGEGLRRPDLRRLFTFIDRVPKFSLRYSSLAEAAACLRAL